MYQVQIKNFGINPAHFAFPFEQWKIFDQFIDSNFRKSFGLLTSGIHKNDNEYKTIRSFRLSANDCLAIEQLSDQQIFEWVHERRGLGRNRLAGRDRFQSYGERLESPAIESYISAHGVDVRKVKLLVNPSFPFLICQADGIAFKNNEPSHIIEVKTMSRSFIRGKPDPRYIKLKNGTWSVRYSSSVYKQVQINMFISNLPFADVILYNEHHNSIYTMRVRRDDEFINHFIIHIYSKLQSIVLPEMVKKFIHRTE